MLRWWRGFAAYLRGHHDRPDRRGLLSKAAGVLALNALSVHSASVNSAVLSGQTSAINTFVVSPHFRFPADRGVDPPAVHPGPER